MTYVTNMRPSRDGWKATARNLFQRAKDYYKKKNETGEMNLSWGMAAIGVGAMHQDPIMIVAGMYLTSSAFRQMRKNILETIRKDNGPQLAPTA